MENFCTRAERLNSPWYRPRGSPTRGALGEEEARAAQNACRSAEKAPPRQRALPKMPVSFIRTCNVGWRQSRRVRFRKGPGPRERLVSVHILPLGTLRRRIFSSLHREVKAEILLCHTSRNVPAFTTLEMSNVFSPWHSPSPRRRREASDYSVRQMRQPSRLEGLALQLSRFSTGISGIIPACKKKCF